MLLPFASINFLPNDFSGSHFRLRTVLASSVLRHHPSSVLFFFLRMPGAPVRSQTLSHAAPWTDVTRAGMWFSEHLLFLEVEEIGVLSVSRVTACLMSLQLV